MEETKGWRNRKQTDKQRRSHKGFKTMNSQQSKEAMKKGTVSKRK